LNIARIVSASDPGMVEEAAQIIRRGGLVAFPTETVYGLGADVGNALAVARIFEVKNRPRIDPVIVHVSDMESACFYGRVPDSARCLAERFWPGPLTLVVPRNASVPTIVTAGLDTVAIRVPGHHAALALIRRAGCGIAAPSANPFGYVSPTEARHVAEQLKEKLDLILDGGPCAVGLESTILSLLTHPPRLLRPGGVSIEDIESVVGKIEIAAAIAERPQAPGQLERHYATRTRLEIVEESLEDPGRGEKIGLLSLFPPAYPNRYSAIEILSPEGDLREAAANLFRALRRLDSMSLDRILARPIREEGLGIAIMDRLRRCAADPNLSEVKADRDNATSAANSGDF
jgi:L-threonylcarbamoyladenylate synthase